MSCCCSCNIISSRELRLLQELRLQNWSRYSVKQYLFKPTMCQKEKTDDLVMVSFPEREFQF